MEFLIILILIGLIPAAIASNKGYNFVGWWIYGALLFIVALPHALMKSRNVVAVEAKQAREEGRRKCPHCAELIKEEAKVCRFCGREVVPPPPPQVSRPSATPTPRDGRGVKVSDYIALIVGSIAVVALALVVFAFTRP